MDQGEARELEPVEWLVYASHLHTLVQIEAVLSAGRFWAEDTQLVSPLMPARDGVVRFQVLVTDTRSDVYVQVAECVVRALSATACTINMNTLPIVEDIGPVGHTLSEVGYKELQDELSRRFRRVGVEYDDMRAPEFSGQRPRTGSPTAIAKPSERSMWVDPVFHERVFRKRDDLCFVIMPFRDELTQFFDHAVKPVVTGLGLECKLAKDFRGGHSDIIEEIWVALNEARFIIADLTGQNPNVYYELGMAETLGKRVIAIHKNVPSGEQLPFDVRVRRTVFYEDTMAGGAAFQAELREHIEAILQSQA